MSQITPWKKAENMGMRKPKNSFHWHDISFIVFLEKESYLKMSNSHFQFRVFPVSVTAMTYKQ